MLNHFVFNRTISQSIYIYNETDKTSDFFNYKTTGPEIKREGIHKLRMAVTVFTQEKLTQNLLLFSLLPTES